MTTTGRQPDQPQQHQTPTDSRPDADHPRDRSASAIARIDAVLAEAGRPQIVLVDCIGPTCERQAFPWLGLACSPECAREAAQLKRRPPVVQVHDGTDWQSIPVTAAEVRLADEREPSTLDQEDLELLYQLEDAFDRRERCDERVLELHGAGQLRFHPARNEWSDHHGEPLIPPLQQAATRLARAGALPEFIQWFDPRWSAPAPDGNRDFVVRPADEPQDLVDNSQVAFTLQPSDAELRADGIEPDECPPRPPEPPQWTAEQLLAAAVARHELLARDRARPWWRRWLRRG